jgi:hypothetical protein
MQAPEAVGRERRWRSSLLQIDIYKLIREDPRRAELKAL